MFKKILRKIRPNPLDSLLRRAVSKKKKKFLFAWNRGLGDIALGLYAIVHRVREFVPDAQITFLIRKNLDQGFSLLQGIDEVLIAPDWERAKPYDVEKTLHFLGRNPDDYEVIVPWPDPTYWVSWQRGYLVPKLKWESANEKETFLEKDLFYVGLQPLAETNYGLWRNWPLENWKRLVEKIVENKKARILLFGFAKEPIFSHSSVIDLRGQTDLYSLLSIIKKHCKSLLLPDSGILSMTYFLDQSFPIKVVSLWADSNHGILKQNVPSPNPQLEHIPLIAKERNLSLVGVDEVYQHLMEGLF